MNPETKCNKYQYKVKLPFYHESYQQQQAYPYHQNHLMQPQPYFQPQRQNNYQSQQQILPQAALPSCQVFAMLPQLPTQYQQPQYRPQLQRLVQGNRFTSMQSTQSQHQISHQPYDMHQQPRQVQPQVFSLGQQTHVDNFTTIQQNQMHQQNQLQVQEDDRFNAQQSRIYNEKHRNYEAIMNRGALVLNFADLIKNIIMFFNSKKLFSYIAFL